MNIFHFPFSIFNLNTAMVTNCHEDAYLDCTWLGGDGISFSNNHSLTTTINWNSTNGVAWATNYVDLVTTYEGGYAVTNHYGITVGGSDVPPLRLSMTGQDVYFLNDYDNGNRTERVYRVSFELQGPHDTTGNLSVESVGGAEMKFFFEKGLLGPATNSIPMSIGEDGYFCTTNLYLACPELGRGRVVASFRSDGGGTVSTSRTCRVIEPLRRLVTNETCPNSRRYVNPSCLVYGTNAVLRVDVIFTGAIEDLIVTGLPEGAGSEWLTDKIKVGAHYIDFRAIKGEGSREK